MCATCSPTKNDHLNGTGIDECKQFDAAEFGICQLLLFVRVLSSVVECAGTAAFCVIIQ